MILIDAIAILVRDAALVDGNGCLFDYLVDFCDLCDARKEHFEFYYDDLCHSMMHDHIILGTSSKTRQEAHAVNRIHQDR